MRDIILVVGYWRLLIIFLSFKDDSDVRNIFSYVGRYFINKLRSTIYRTNKRTDNTQRSREPPEPIRQPPVNDYHHWLMMIILVNFTIYFINFLFCPKNYDTLTVITMQRTSINVSNFSYQCLNSCCIHCRNCLKPGWLQGRLKQLHINQYSCLPVKKRNESKYSIFYGFTQIALRKISIILIKIM